MAEGSATDGAGLIAEGWDPLEPLDAETMFSVQKREIRNVLKSYTGYFDVFCELLQNALDAVDRRASEGEASYRPSIWIDIDMKESTLTVADNGCGMDETTLRGFLKPNVSFKDRRVSRGCKGVGATYLGFGFDLLEVVTRVGAKTTTASIKQGRSWTDDDSGSILRPRCRPMTVDPATALRFDRGTSMLIRLGALHSRPRDLSWLGARTAQQWTAILRVVSPLGGISLGNRKSPEIHVETRVVAPDGSVTTETLQRPWYLFPHELIKSKGDIREYLKDLDRRTRNAEDTTQPPKKYRGLAALWGQWSGKELLEPSPTCPVRPRLDQEERDLLLDLGVDLYVFLAFSTKVWDTINEKQLGVRESQKVLRGGLQLATRSMPQGLPIRIPLTSNIGLQNQAHVVFHMENAEPDLGRKGFQPEVTHLAEKIAASAVGALHKHYKLLRKPSGSADMTRELVMSEWIQTQIAREKSDPLVISGRGLFSPQHELAIRTKPCVEQDVVALFNQMLSSGVVRGLALIASSSHEQYDGLFRVQMDKPFDRFILSDDNPLGIPEDAFADAKGVVRSKEMVLEYKFSIDGLIEEFSTGAKQPKDLGLAVAWEMGTEWRTMFTVTSLLVPDNVHHRRIHGSTHLLAYTQSGEAFPVIILSDLVGYLQNREAEVSRQREVYEQDL